MPGKHINQHAPFKFKHGQKKSQALVNSDATGHRTKRRRLSNASTEPDAEALALMEAKKKMGKERAKLPIYNYISLVMGNVSMRPVLILSGATGSGKSTQVPRYLETQDWCEGAIAVTQPRRVAAINLARRVAQECFCSLGGKIGYSVRFDTKVSAATRIKYLTEGSLLQEMLHDPFLKHYDCVIVDEVHERSVDCDLLLGFLRRIITDKDVIKKHRNGRMLRVVVMSATADVNRLFEFFHTGFGVPVEKTVMKVSQRPNHPGTATGLHPLTEASQKNGVDHGKKKNKKQSLAAMVENKLKALDVSPNKANGANNTNGSEKADQENQSEDEDSESETVYTSDHVSLLQVEGRQFPVTEIFQKQDDDEFVEAALDTLVRINKTEPMPGDVLVFMTGQDTVTALMSYLRDKVGTFDKGIPDIYPLPLYAALPRNAQQAVFEPGPRGARKIIVATNIAETSLTIPGVRYVVDAGRVKEKEFRPALVLDALLVRPTSTASAMQRAGRAGREAPGKCWRLYSREHANSMPDAGTPEVLRTDLMRVALVLKARGVADPLSFPLLDPPSPEAWRDALFRLTALRALGSEGQLLRAGKQMARLPLYPGHAAVIIAAAERDRASNPADDASQATSKATKSTKPPPPQAPKLLPAQSLALLAIDAIAAVQGDEPFALPLAHHPAGDGSSEHHVDEADAQQAGHTGDVAARLDRQRALHSRAGDHATALAMLTAYARVPRRARREWADARHLSGRALRAALEVRTQLRAASVAVGLVHPWTVAEAAREEEQPDDDDDDDDDSEDEDGRWARKTNTAATARAVRGASPPPAATEDQLAGLARCLLAGFWTNVATLQAGSTDTGGRRWYALALSGARVEVHPSSVLWGRRPAPAAIVFGELVHTTRAYARTVSAVQLEWIRDVVGGGGHVVTKA